MLNPLLFKKGVHLPKDSIDSGQLISSLNGFLSQKESLTGIMPLF